MLALLVSNTNQKLLLCVCFPTADFNTCHTGQPFCFEVVSTHSLLHSLDSSLSHTRFMPRDSDLVTIPGWQWGAPWQAQPCYSVARATAISKLSKPRLATISQKLTLNHKLPPAALLMMEISFSCGRASKNLIGKAKPLYTGFRLLELSPIFHHDAAHTQKTKASQNTPCTSSGRTLVLTTVCLYFRGQSYSSKSFSWPINWSHPQYEDPVLRKAPFDRWAAWVTMAKKEQNPVLNSSWSTSNFIFLHSL